MPFFRLAKRWLLRNPTFLDTVDKIDFPCCFFFVASLLIPVFALFRQTLGTTATDTKGATGATTKCTVSIVEPAGLGVVCALCRSALSLDQRVLVGLASDPCAPFDRLP